MDKKWYIIMITLDSNFSITSNFVTVADIVYEEKDFFVTKVNGRPYIEDKGSKMLISNEHAITGGGYHICGAHYGTKESAYEQAWIEFNEYINPKVREVVEVPKFNGEGGVVDV